MRAATAKPGCPDEASVAVRPLRRDAAENRERLLDAARFVFAEYGLDASVEEVARAAGVGMGTLYRRFPTKQALIDELVGSMRRELLVLAQNADGLVDGSGLETLLLNAGKFQAKQPSCLQRLWSHSDAELGAMDDFREIVATLLERAQQNGRIRPEVTSTDISMIFWSVRSIIEMTRAVAPTAWRRHLELLIAGLRPVAAENLQVALVEKPLTRTQAQRCMDGDAVREGRR
ncbi:TetR family transcriptional regulator [Jatrophihabitans sp. GAS493]|uniref:TetR/AcrR family transcriptional regulator n=1 Tax=Jatrophihabitans sp. GAS493 TaxID=1907575 RepID=UPI000BB93BD2|nr:TetR/AcrR family transcriptional regulator [Jatrophihabitans sp. GAS493]SOD74505.1 TetR family transcriptional regulator [Jatrophihabitans sp. GAS493]